ncbi:TNF receptor-associated factor 5-like [Sycon ciliatum]|uniref:TNF receptor-associated factor 5-like n=1 Tax=Sycon ciliatum TaxID=27933 RepID=UPI0031F68E3C
MAVKPPGSMPWRKSRFQRKGYPPEIFQDAKFREKKYLCSHCHQVLDQPRSGPCGHRYCRLCLEDRIDRMRPTAECYWKDCQAVLKPAELVDEKDLANELEKQTVKCDSGLCEWSGCLRDYVKHEEECQYGYSCCPFGCDVKTPRRQISRHYKQHALLHQDLQTAEQQPGVIDQLKTEVEKVQHDVDAMQMEALKRDIPSTDITTVLAKLTEISSSMAALTASQQAITDQQDKTQQHLGVLSQRLEKVELDTTASCERIVQVHAQTNTAVGQLQEEIRNTTTNIGQLQEQSRNTTTNIGQLQEEILKTTTTIGIYLRLLLLSGFIVMVAVACLDSTKNDSLTNNISQLQEQSATTSTSIGQLLEQQQDTNDKVSRVSAAVTTIQQGEQDTTAACERIVEMQNQTNTTVRQLQEQSATTSASIGQLLEQSATSATSIGQLLEQQQDTSHKLSRVSAAVTTIQRVWLVTSLPLLTSVTKDQSTHTDQCD